MTKVMVDEKENELSVAVPGKDCPTDSIKLTAYLFMDRADPLIEPAPAGVTVRLRFRAKLNRKALEREGADFVKELEAQRLNGEIQARNRPIVEYIVRQALVGANTPEPAAKTSELELSQEEEKELDRLIAEVEGLMAKEPKSGGDPLGIKATWEEAHGGKPGSKKGAKAKPSPVPSVKERPKTSKCAVSPSSKKAVCKRTQAAPASSKKAAGKGRKKKK